ncbi:MAG TPA: IS630 family transposase [Ktedonobacterales bacterium]|nr:IS630 family transposase [Ktedonobacterales bacterium]
MASLTGYTAYWIGQIARRYNTAGPEGVRDLRRRSKGFPALLSEEQQQAALRAALAVPHPAGDHWCGRTVAACMSTHLGRRVSRQAAWRALRQLGARFLKPRPRHVQADPAAQALFKARLRLLLREVATAFPQATLELWAVDEHRIGLKPIFHKAWCVDGQRPLAPVQQRYEWRYLVGFVHPASGRTLFHLGTSIRMPLFEAELAAFARQAEAGAEKQIVLVLDRAGWHSTQRLRVPDHVHLLFLPPYSPELQPAEHLWPLTNTVLANRHFASIEELEDAQAERCVALQGRPELIRSATRFSWWPLRVKKRLYLHRKSARTVPCIILIYVLVPCP